MNFFVSNKLYFHFIKNYCYFKKIIVYNISLFSNKKFQQYELLNNVRNIFTCLMLIHKNLYIEPIVDRIILKSTFFLITCFPVDQRYFEKILAKH